MIAKNIMRKDVIYVKPDQSLKDAVILMTKYNISGLPVIDEQGKVVGIISESDILCHGKKIFMPDCVDLIEFFLYEQLPDSYETELRNALKLKVKDLMVTDIVVASENTPVGQIALMMVENDINRVPIISKGILTGIVGRDDIIRAIAQISQTEDTVESAN